MNIKVKSGSTVQKALKFLNYMFDEHLSSPNRSCEFLRRNFGTGRVRHFYSRTSARKGYSYLTCYQRIVGYIF